MGKVISIVARIDERFGGKEVKGSYRVDGEIVTAWHPDGRKKSAGISFASSSMISAL